MPASAGGDAPGPGEPITTTRIPAGHYFVMGDDRGNSSDSRVFGPISSSLIVGRADARIWPLGRAGGL
jgi:signal peptidase I